MQQTSLNKLFIYSLIAFIIALFIEYQYIQKKPVVSNYAKNMVLFINHVGVPQKLLQ